MNRSQIIIAVSTKTNLPPKTVDKAITSFFNSIIEGLNNDEKAELRGFGSFRLKRYKAYMGRNPKDGKVIDVKAKRLPIFRSGKSLRDMVDPNN
jgi:integration host factor subunit beta